MHILDSRRANIIAACYLAAVVVSAALAFRSGDLFSFGWFLVVMCLTLPWGVLNLLFMWALIHDNTHYLAMSVHIGWGILNVLIALKFAQNRRRNRLRRLTGSAQ